MKRLFGVWVYPYQESKFYRLQSKFGTSKAKEYLDQVERVNKARSLAQR